MLQFNVKKFDIGAKNANYVVLGIANDLSCIILATGGGTSNPKAINFNAATVGLSGDMSTNAVIATAAQPTWSNAVPAKLIVGSSCKAFTTDTATAAVIYRSHDNAVTWVKDTAVGTPWTAAVLSDDFMYAATNAGLWKASSANPAVWSQVATSVTTFGANKKIWTLGDKVIVAHWPTSATIVTVQVFGGTPFAQITGAKITTPQFGTDFASTGAIGPGASFDHFISISQSFSKIVVYGKTASLAFYKAVTIDWTPTVPVGAVADLTGSTFFAATVTATDAAYFLSVSDAYIYARNEKNHVGAYFSTDGKTVTEIFQEAMALTSGSSSNWIQSSGADIGKALTTLTKSYLTQSKNNNFYVIHEVTSATAPNSVVTLNEMTKNAYVNQYLDFDRTITARYSQTGVITLTAAYQTYGSFNWFYYGAVSSDATKIMWGSYYLDKTSAKVSTDLQLASTSSYKKSSSNALCAVIADSAGSKIYVYNFSKPATGTTAVLFADISSLTGTAYDISDDCLALRVDTKVYHWDTTANPKAYVLDTASDSTKFTASVPVFSNDFSVAVNEAGIWTYNRKTGIIPGLYTLNRAETYIGLGTGYTILVGKYLVIFRYKLSSTANVYDYNIQANYFVNSTSWLKVKDGEDTGKSTGIPKFDVSENNGKYVVWGQDSTNKVFQTIKDVDYIKNTSKALTIPDAAVKALNLDISITERFFYARSLDSATPKHYGWVIGVSALTESFNEAFSILPKAQTYIRSVLVLDPTGKITVLSQFDSSFTIATVTVVLDSVLTKYQGKTAGEVISPKAITFDYSVSYGNLGTVAAPALTTQQYSSSLSGLTSNFFYFTGQSVWGRWIYMTASDTKVGASIYAYNGATPADKSKTVVLGTATGAAVIRAISYGGDCVITTVGGATTTNLNIYSVDGSGVTLVDDAFSAIQSGNPEITTAELADTKTALFTVSTGCLAFKILRSKVGVSNAHGNYVKSAPSAAAGAKYTKAAFPTSTGYQCRFDPTFRFCLYNSQNVAELNSANNNYVNVITNDYMNNNMYRLSSDGKTLLSILWTNPSTQSRPFRLRFFNFISNAWVPATYNSSNELFYDLSFGAPRVVHTPTMDVVAITYNKTSYAAGSTTVIFKLTISALSFSSYTLPTADFNTAVNLAQQYVYFDETTPTYMQLISIAKAGDSQEIFYTVNKAAATLTQVSRRRVDPADYRMYGPGYLLKGFKFIATDANTLNAFYQYEDENLKKSYVRKSIVFNATMTNYLATIAVHDVGVCMVGTTVTLCNVAGCSSCSEPGSCSGCYNGWVLEAQSNKCFRCDPSCSTCESSSSLTICTSCNDGFYLDGSSCEKCADSCITCLTSSGQSCLTCKFGYYIQIFTAATSSGSCSPCIANCNVCQSATTCNTCVLGFVYNPDLKMCMKCLAGCSVCDPRNITTCIGCASGYRTTTVSATNLTITGCARCSLNCTACTETACTACRIGFRLTTAAPAKCVEVCKLPCTACSQTDSTACTACAAAYSLTGTSCTPNVAACTTASTCTSCPIGYTLAAGKCTACNAGDTCSSCLPTDLTVCGSCKIGYYLSAGSKCSACPSGCSECNNGFTCSRCSAGYVLARPTGASKCIKCDVSCAACYGEPQNCDTCGTGYTLTGWGCVSGNRLVSNWKFAIDFSKFTSTDLTTILSAIAEKLGIASGKIDITSLTSGSVNVGTGVAYSTSAQLSTMQSSLSSLGTNVAGYTVESFSSSVTVDNGNANFSVNNADADYYRSVAVVVGVVIPICLIIIFIIIIILMKKGIICTVDGKSKVKDANGSMGQINVHQKESEQGTMRKN